jgi:hypothetical protein
LVLAEEKQYMQLIGLLSLEAEQVVEIKVLAEEPAVIELLFKIHV